MRVEHGRPSERRRLRRGATAAEYGSMAGRAAAGPVARERGPRMSLRAGTTLDDRYTLLERLGEGGQGSVWRAFDKNTGADRALKILDLTGQDREAAARARREAHLVKDARHPALVACHSLFEIPSEEVLVLVFDFVEARPLADSLGDERFGRAHKLAALRHIAGALAYLHGAGIVHRDLKPDNVLVTPVFWEDPATPSALKLIDFGIAAPRHGPDGATLSGMFGTPPYMAPELFDVSSLDAQRSSARDVFAFGVIGWQMLDGHHPTGLSHKAGAGAYHASYAHFRRGREPWPPRALEGRWGSVIAACLALDPAMRPADGRAILSLLDGAPRTPPPGESSERPSRASLAAQSARRPDITDPHVAPSALRLALSAPAPLRSGDDAVPAPLPRGSAEPASVAARAVERTEPAPASSLPKGAAVDRTTPMPPMVEQVAPRAEDPLPPSKAAPPRSTGAHGGPPAPERSGEPENAGKSTWQAVVIAVLLLFTVVTGTAWLLLGRGVSPPGTPRSPEVSPSASSTGSGQLRTPGSGEPRAAAPSGAATGSTAATAAALVAPPIKVCCPAGKAGCPSGRSCDPAPDCKTSGERVPERQFVLRVIQVEEQPSIYDPKRNLADRDRRPDATVCVQSLAGEGCAPMKSIAATGGSTLSRTVDRQTREPLTVTTSELRKGGVDLRIQDKGKWDPDLIHMKYSGHLSPAALCKSLSLKDSEGRFYLTFHLDDSAAPPATPQAP